MIDHYLIMDISFDIRGNLKPYEKIELALPEFKEVFVDSFEEDSSRHFIYEEYLRYLDDLQKVISNPFHQWINGSFVTNKKSPRDIDFVTFIDHRVYQKLELQIDKQFSKWSVGNFYQNLDAYTIWEYTEDHPFYKTFQSDVLYWQDWFSHTQFNRAKKRFSKGFIEIKFL